MASKVGFRTPCHYYCNQTVIKSTEGRRYSMNTPKKLTTRQRGKLQALLTIAHGDNVQGLNARALFKVHNLALSEDLVQTTFMKTWVYLVRGGKIDMMRAFLYHILNGLIIDEYRKRKTTSLDVLLEKGFDPGSDSSDRTIDVLDGKSLILLINQLPKMYQKIMRMRYIQDLSLVEMSLLTGQTKNTIAVQSHRGLRRLKTLRLDTVNQFEKKRVINARTYVQSRQSSN